jgi:hypothetical protein
MKNYQQQILMRSGYWWKEGEGEGRNKVDVLYILVWYINVEIILNRGE